MSSWPQLLHAWARGLNCYTHELGASIVARMSSGPQLLHAWARGFNCCTHELGASIIERMSSGPQLLHAWARGLNCCTHELGALKVRVLPCETYKLLVHSSLSIIVKYTGVLITSHCSWVSVLSLNFFRDHILAAPHTCPLITVHSLTNYRRVLLYNSTLQWLYWTCNFNWNTARLNYIHQILISNYLLNYMICLLDTLWQPFFPIYPTLPCFNAPIYILHLCSPICIYSLYACVGQITIPLAYELLIDFWMKKMFAFGDLDLSYINCNK